ncbi:MAG: hypothetical protein R3E98_14210 [Gemmatimonadota bacterium]
MRTPYPLRLLLFFWALAAPLHAQDAHRIWARVHTHAGEVHEGFLRWDRNEASWVDLLDGTKTLPEDAYDTWIAEQHGGERPVRAIQLRGYRVTWDEEDPDFPTRVASGIRFGHLAELVVADEDSVDLVLKGGGRVSLSGGATDLGPSLRELIVERNGRTTELEWEDVERVTFAAVPAGERARSQRLYGTVQDDRGRSFTGFLAWDLDEAFTSDILDGRDDDGDEHDIPFGDIASIEAERRSAKVTLRSGRTLELSGSNDVGRGHRGVQISDPGLGMIEVEWDALERVDFEPAPDGPAYDAFDGGAPLQGTVVTQTGEEIRGTLRWDMDETYTWELLDGRAEDDAFVVGVGRVGRIERGHSFKVELGRIARIERGEAFGVRVVLVDGRELVMDDSNDVDWDNKGILITPAPSEDGGEPAQRYVSWEEFKEVRFGSAAASAGGPR